MPRSSGSGDDGIKLTPLGDAVGSVTSMNSAVQIVALRASKAGFLEPDLGARFQELDIAK
jgi:hypothetical protein